MFKRLRQAIAASTKQKQEALEQQSASREQIRKALEVHYKLESDMKHNHYAELIMAALGVNKPR